MARLETNEIEFGENVEQKKGFKLVDPMIIEESAEALEAKKKNWMDICEEIFDRYPDWADNFAQMYKAHGGMAIETMSRDLYKYGLIRGIINDEIRFEQVVE